MSKRHFTIIFVILAITLIVLKEKIHGTQDISVELKFKNWTKNQTSTNYKVDC